LKKRVAGNRDIWVKKESLENLEFKRANKGVDVKAVQATVISREDGN
jgi:hypothetical protein